jgi:hypothetical protein
MTLRIIQPRNLVTDKYIKKVLVDIRDNIYCKTYI